ncbi:hypothetical protein AAT19DRAFT_10186 [Rhodotorula toruloides]|uniref:Uncharacterized protein n=1 Tax=Rhodotorula toruloides TaxID=5286 RepID=A0A2S9ZZY5_RHOTO|nr:hypothetical protein AAT19DRAFT_10186 [Rhodotorula toruloides]
MVGIGPGRLHNHPARCTRRKKRRGERESAFLRIGGDATRSPASPRRREAFLRRLALPSYADCLCEQAGTPKERPRDAGLQGGLSDYGRIILIFHTPWSFSLSSCLLSRRGLLAVRAKLVRSRKSFPRSFSLACKLHPAQRANLACSRSVSNCSRAGCSPPPRALYSVLRKALQVATSARRSAERTSSSGAADNGSRGRGRGGGRSRRELDDFAWNDDARARLIH